MDDTRRLPLWSIIRGGNTAWLCGVSDGRGKACGRILKYVEGFDLTVEDDVILTCSKHGQVFCEGAEFVAGTGRRSAIYFRSLPRP